MLATTKSLVYQGLLPVESDNEITDLKEEEVEISIRLLAEKYLRHQSD